MRLLNVIRSIDPALGGTVEGLRQQVMATAALGHRPEVVTLDGDADAGVATFPAPTHALGPVASHYGYSRRLVPWLRENAADYDAVIVHGLWQYPSFATWRALHGAAVPYFVYPHGMLDPWFKRRYPLKHVKKNLYWPWAEYRVLRDAAAVLFTADEEARLAAQSFRPYRVTPAVVGFGIDLDGDALGATAEPFLARWPELRDKRLVLFLGRLHEKKGGDLLIEAFAEVVRDAPSLHLLMAGPDGAVGERAQLEALAARLGIASRITWTGMLEGALKWSALRSAEVFVLPSHQENFGIAVVEALSLGVPVIVSDKVNIWREIVDSGAGFAGDDSAAATTVNLRRWLALDEAGRRSMRAAATACYARSFTMQAAAKRLLSAISAHIAASDRARQSPPIHGRATKAP